MPFPNKLSEVTGMNDPHVETLNYTVESFGPNSWDYESAATLSHHASDVGDFIIDRGVLTVKLSTHYPDEQTARYFVDRFLRNWEIHNDLTGNYGAIRFKFTGATTIDRNPSPDGPAVEIFVSEQLLISNSVSFRVSPGRYPDPPPANFAGTGNIVKDAHLRWCQYKDGKEPVRSMAYFVLTLIETEAKSASGTGGAQQKAARIFNIDESVLKKIGEISSVSGTAQTARKVNANARNQYVSETAADDEILRVNSALEWWLEDAITTVLMHLGRLSTHEVPDRLTLDDLRSLPKVAK